ncbi:MAG: DUF488 domain-containing protein [Pyrinomonadaceae bacterium]
MPDLIKSSATIWTIGHSTRPAEEFARILKSHAIGALIDVRSFPGSRRYPHFNKEQLSQLLTMSNIHYFHFPSLGGRRKPNPESRNTAWQNASFRAYADHMESADFKKGIEELLQLSALQRTTVMCAEALWWRCHRSLISDYLKVLGVEVTHIADEKRTEVHPYTGAARIVEGRLSYEGLFS